MQQLVIYHPYIDKFLIEDKKIGLRWDDVPKTVLANRNDITKLYLNACARMDSRIYWGRAINDSFIARDDIETTMHVVEHYCILLPVKIDIFGRIKSVDHFNKMEIQKWTI